MDTNITSGAPTPQVAAAPPIAASPTPQASPMVSPTSSTGGGNMMSTIKNLNWIEVGFGILGATALYYAIYYYRYNIKQSQAFALNVQNRLDELDIKLADVNSVFLNDQQQPAPSFNDTFLI